MRKIYDQISKIDDSLENSLKIVLKEEERGMENIMVSKICLRTAIFSS